MAMTMSGERVSTTGAARVTSAPASAASSPPSSRAAAPAAAGPAGPARGDRPPWWCAHRSRSSALGVLVTAALVCVAAGVAVVGLVSTGSTIAAVVALAVLAVGAANVVSGSFGAAWWARRARASEEVPSMNATDDPRRAPRPADDAPRRPAPVVPAAREGRHAAPSGDAPTTRIPTSPPGGRRARPAGPSDPTEALPTQQHPLPPVPGPPGAPGAPVVPDGEQAPAADTGERSGPATVRAAAKRAAARPSSKIKRVAGRSTPGT